MKKNTIYLDAIDGFEFENLCKNIFLNLNYGHVETTSLVADKGRDLIIHSNEGKIFVECKHQPNSSIGRPVIQKLHSAVISGGAIKGIVITTGTFSKQAIQYAKSLEPPIELMDRGVLYDLASRAGIELATSLNEGTVYTFPIIENTLLKNNLSEYLKNIIISTPKRIENILQINRRRIQLRPIYEIKYSINAVFSTTVGVIHTECDSGTLFIDGNSGIILDENLSKSFMNIPMDKFSNIDTKNISIIPFEFLSGIVKESAIDYIINKHTRTVYYTGRNNQTYKKVCEPKKNDIFISNISQVYIPENDIYFTLIGKNRFIKIADNGTPNFFVYNDNISNCEICGKNLNNTGLLCNDCGTISHNQTFFKSHGFFCEKCGKSICRNCAYYFWKYLIIKITICKDCATQEIKNGRKIKKYKSIK